jgi:hypothetical protein
MFRRNEDLLDKEEPLRVRASKLGSRIVESSWFNRVDSIIGFQAFFQAAQEQWAQLKRKSRDEEVSKEEFLNGLRIRLAGFWDESLRPIAEAFYAKAAETFARARPRAREAGEGKQRRNSGEIWSDIQTQLRSVWEQRVVNTWQQKVVSPATTLYASALSFYLTTKPSDSAKTFVDGMRGRLGQSWNENLEQPLREFFTGARLVVQDDLLGLQAKFQRLVPTVSQAAAVANSLTMGDALAAGTRVVVSTQSKIQRAVSGVWNFVLSASQATMDVVLPPVSDSSIEDKKSGEPGEEDVAPTPLSVSSICGEALKRTKAWALKGWGQLRKLSTEQLKPRISVDLAASAERVVTGVYAEVKSAIDGVQERSNLLVEHGKARIQDVQLAVAKAITGIRQSIHLPPAIKPVTDHIQLSTSNVIQRVSGIVNLTRQYLLSREIRKIPVDSFHLFFQAPFIMLALILDSEGNSGEGEFRELTQALRALLKSVKEVFIWKREPPRADHSEDIPVVRAQDQERPDSRPSPPRVDDEDDEDDEEAEDAGTARRK